MRRLVWGTPLYTLCSNTQYDIFSKLQTPSWASNMHYYEHITEESQTSWLCQG